MKNILFISCFILLSSFAHAYESANQHTKSEQSFHTSNFLIKDGLNKNFHHIQQHSLHLTQSQKFALYNMHENSMGIPLVLNIVVGFGLGSWIQGDLVGGFAGSIGDALGIVMIYVGAISALTYEADWNTYTVTYPNYDKGVRVMTAGAVLLCLSRVAQVVFPITYSPRYNKKLQNALDYHNVSFDVTPTVDNKGNGSLAVAMSYKF